MACTVRCTPASDEDRLLTRVSIANRYYIFSSAAQMIMLLGTRIDVQRSAFYHVSPHFGIYFARHVSRSRLPMRRGHATGSGARVG